MRVAHRLLFAERPIRDFEILSDVLSSWNHDKMLNALMVKMTPLSSILGPSVRAS